jgi:hypothetical protein
LVRLGTYDAPFSFKLKSLLYHLDFYRISARPPSAAAIPEQHLLARQPIYV